MNTKKTTMGERIFLLRRMKGISQEDLARHIGVSRQSVSKWELGDSEPETAKIVELSRYFGISTDELLGMIDCKSNGNEIVPHKSTREKKARPLIQEGELRGILRLFGKGIKKHSYAFGYILMLYGAVILIFQLIGRAMLKGFLSNQQQMIGFGALMDPPGTSAFSGFFTVLLFLGIVLVVGGFILSLILKKKFKK